MNFILPGRRHRRGLPRRSGQAALSTIFLIGGIIIFISLTLAFLAVSFLNSSLGWRTANQASAVASAGANDALLRLVRSKDFGAPSLNYTVAINSSMAGVTVTNSGNGQVIIISSSTIGLNSRTIQVIVSITTSTGQVNVVSWQQL